MLQFRPIALSDRDMVQGYLREKDIPGDQYSFGNLFIWRNVYHAEICEEEGFLYVKSGPPGDYDFMCPMGSGDLKAAVNKLREWCRENGCHFRMRWVPANEKALLETLFPGMLQITSDRDHAAPKRKAALSSRPSAIFTTCAFPAGAAVWTERSSPIPWESR